MKILKWKKWLVLMMVACLFVGDIVPVHATEELITSETAVSTEAGEEAEVSVEADASEEAGETEADVSSEEIATTEASEASEETATTEASEASEEITTTEASEASEETATTEASEASEEIATTEASEASEEIASTEASETSEEMLSSEIQMNNAATVNAADAIVSLEIASSYSKVLYNAFNNNTYSNVFDSKVVIKATMGDGSVITFPRYSDFWFDNEFSFNVISVSNPEEVIPNKNKLENGEYEIVISSEKYNISCSMPFEVVALDAAENVAQGEEKKIDGKTHVFRIDAEKEGAYSVGFDTDCMLTFQVYRADATLYKTYSINCTENGNRYIRLTEGTNYIYIKNYYDIKEINFTINSMPDITSLKVQETEPFTFGYGDWGYYVGESVSSNSKYYSGKTVSGSSTNTRPMVSNSPVNYYSGSKLLNRFNFDITLEASREDGSTLEMFANSFLWQAYDIIKEILSPDGSEVYSDRNGYVPIGEYTVEFSAGDTTVAVPFAVTETAKVKDIRKCEILIDDYFYSGAAIKPVPTVTYGTKVLKKNRDYIISYENNIEGGTATAIIQGINGYSGTIKKEFRIIEKQALEKLTYNGDALSFGYGTWGYYVKNSASVHISGNSVPVGNVAVSGISGNNIAGGSISGNNTSGGIVSGNSTGVKMNTRPLVSNTPVDGYVSGNWKSAYNFDVTLDATLKDGSSLELVCNSVLWKFFDVIQSVLNLDDSPVYTDQNGYVAIGDYVVEFAVGETSISVPFSVTETEKVKDIRKAIVNFEKQTYTGTEITPIPEIVCNEQALVKGKDYIISYTNNIEVGTATAIIKGINSYSGILEAEFIIKKDVPDGVGYDESTGKHYYYLDGEIDTSKDGLVIDDNTHQWVYCESGEWIADKFDFVALNDSKFLVANGVVASEVSGLQFFGNEFYFLAYGQLQDHYAGLTMYDNEWFYVADGMLQIDFNGIQNHDGSKFLIAAGRIVSDYTGLYGDETTGTWYYIVNGQVQTQYTGLVAYDGEWFYLKEGVLAGDYTGTVIYDGAEFNVVNGMVVS